LNGSFNPLAEILDPGELLKRARQCSPAYPYQEEQSANEHTASNHVPEIQGILSRGLAMKVLLRGQRAAHNAAMPQLLRAPTSTRARTASAATQVRRQPPRHVAHATAGSR
jgi:hypothetical protein